MKVILLQDVAKIGKAGAVKEVKAGYGFNYLLPEGLAALATPGALHALAKQQAQKAEKIVSSIEETQKKAALLSGKTIHMQRPAENGKLFGSVTKEEIAHEASTEGFAVLPGEIILEKAIKKTGVFSLHADFGHGSKAKFTIEIAADSK